MKNLGIKISLSGMVAMAILLVVGNFWSRAADTVPQDPDSFVNSFCFDGKVAEMDIQDISNVYTQKTNEYFNEKIKTIMSNPSEIADPEKGFPSVTLNDYAEHGGELCKDSGSGADVKDMTCQSIAVCNPADGKPNPNPYCLGVTLLGFSPEKYQYYNLERLKQIEPLKYSYFCYAAALYTKRDALFDGTPQAALDKCDSGSEFANADICKLKTELESETDPVKKAEIQQKMNQILQPQYWGSTQARGFVTSITGTLVDLNDASAKRIEYLDKEPKRAKAALDQTLEAYAQLKTSWTMHVKYMDIFAELVKYRDHLVEIRKQTDTFPLRFIDATTTKCL